MSFKSLRVYIFWELFSARLLHSLDWYSLHFVTKISTGKLVALSFTRCAGYLFRSVCGSAVNRSQSLHAQFCERSELRSLRLPHAPSFWAAKLVGAIQAPLCRPAFVAPCSQLRALPFSHQRYRSQQKSINFAMKFIVSHKVTQTATATATAKEPLPRPCHFPETVIESG